MLDDDLWRHHAYVYGFRRVQLGEFGESSPPDPMGKFFNALGADRAEAFYRTKLGKPRWPRAVKASGGDAIRADCERIRAHELTKAERDYLGPFVERMAEQVRQAVAEFVKRSRRAFAEHHTHYEAREIAAPKGFESAKLTPQRANELMGKLGPTSSDREAHL